MLVMGEHINTTVDSANMLRIMPDCGGFADWQKLNLYSERLLSVVGANVAHNRYVRDRGQTKLENSSDSGFKPSLLTGDLLNCHVLAQDLDISILAVEATIRDYSVLAERGDGNNVSGLNRLKRDVD
jgi:3-hydroxyisobutyrate dehydrogenase-like beta-hydroxyacid dehydrogenase